MTTPKQHKKWRMSPRGRELWKAARIKYRRAHPDLVSAGERRTRRRRAGWPEWLVDLPPGNASRMVWGAWLRWRRRQKSTTVDAKNAPGRAGDAGRTPLPPGPQNTPEALA